MKNRRNKPATVEYTTFSCDCCKKEFVDVLDIQEFLCIDVVGGFNSAIGDEVHYRCDLCSSCVKKLLGEYLQIITGSEWKNCCSGSDTIGSLNVNPKD